MFELFKKEIIDGPHCIPFNHFSTKRKRTVGENTQMDLLPFCQKLLKTRFDNNDQIFFILFNKLQRIRFRKCLHICIKIFGVFEFTGKLIGEFTSVIINDQSPGIEHLHPDAVAKKKDKQKRNDIEIDDQLFAYHLLHLFFEIGLDDSISHALPPASGSLQYAIKISSNVLASLCWA